MALTDPAAVHGLNGEPLTPGQADALVADIERRRVGNDVVTPPGAAVRVRVSTVFVVEIAALTADKDGPWETLVSELPTDAGDESTDDELMTLRWPDADTARQAHGALVGAMADQPDLYRMLAAARAEVRAHLAEIDPHQ